VQIKIQAWFRNHRPVSESTASELAETHTLTVRQHGYFSVQSAAAEKLHEREVYGPVATTAVMPLRIVGGGVQNWAHSAPRPFTVLLCLPRLIVRMENYSVE
jgi:hypothetical protein